MLDFIYNHSPIFFQNIMASVKGHTFIKERYNQTYYDELRRLLNSDNHYELQNERLKSFLSFIKENSTFYKERLKDFDVEQLDVKDIDKLPALTKDEIKQHLDDMLTRDTDLIKMATGGSTGRALTFYTHPDDISRRIAYLDYFKIQHGVFPGRKRLSFSGRQIIPSTQKSNKYWRFNKPLNQLLISTYHLNDENIEKIIEKLNQFKPESIDGITSSIHKIAKYIVKHQIHLDFAPLAVFPTADPLTNEIRDDIERAFNAPVRNQYASSEGAPFITENVKRELEICPATGVFELEHVQDNIYELVVTSFFTTTTPLLRYKIKDAVELEAPLPDNYTQHDIKVKRVIGRSADFLHSEAYGVIDNVKLSAAVRDFADYIYEAQFIQNTKDSVDVYISLANDKVTEDYLQKHMTTKLKSIFGGSTEFKFHFQEQLEMSKNGKTRFAINNIK